MYEIANWGSNCIASEFASIVQSWTKHETKYHSSTKSSEWKQKQFLAFLDARCYFRPWADWSVQWFTGPNSMHRKKRRQKWYWLQRTECHLYSDADRHGISSHEKQFWHLINVNNGPAMFIGWFESSKIQWMCRNQWVYPVRFVCILMTILHNKNGQLTGTNAAKKPNDERKQNVCCLFSGIQCTIPEQNQLASI